MTNGAGGGRTDAVVAAVTCGATIAAPGTVVAPALLVMRAVNEIASGSRKERLFIFCPYVGGAI